MKPLLIALLISLTTALAACSRDREPAVVTLPENAPTTTTTVPATPAPPPQNPAEEPPEPPVPAWVVQVGGAGDDLLNAIVGDQAEVVSVGSTSAGIDTPTVGGSDVLSIRLSDQGEVIATSQFGSAQADSASSVTVVESGDGSEGALSVPVSCGTTLGDLAGPPLGLFDGWCGPAATLPPDESDKATGVFGMVLTPFGAESDETITGASAPQATDSLNPAVEANLFLSGTTSGFYPSAGDSAGRGLGNGDALAFLTSLSRGTTWIRQFGTPAADAATAVRSVGGNGYFAGWTDGDLSGTSKGGRDAWVSMIDTQGMQRWITQFGYAANEEFSAIADLGDPSRGDQQFVAVGFTDGDGPSVSKGGRDALIAGFGPNGSAIWSLQLASVLDDTANGVATDGSTIYVAGTTTSAPATADRAAIDGLGDLDDTIGPGGLSDGFLSAVDATTGQELWTIRFGSAVDDTVTSVATTESGLLVVAGTTKGSLGDNVSAGGIDGFVLAFQLPSAGGGAASIV